MAHLDDEDAPGFVLDVAEDAVVPYTVAPEFL